MNTNFTYLVVAVVCGASFACGGTTAPTPSNGAGDDSGGGPSGASDDGGAAGDDADSAAEAAPPPDHGAPSSTYPAFLPDEGQIVNNGGLVMTTPIIVPITWNTDMAQSTFDAFVDTLGASNFWHQAVSEYGVQAATSGTDNHVHMTTPPPMTLTDSDLQNMVSTNAGVPTDAGVMWPAATDQTIYAFFLPPGTSLDIGGQGGSQDACSAGVGGYHEQVALVGGAVTSYAVVPSCTFRPGTTATQQSTMSMSHELAEAATDPHPNDKPNGYEGFDPEHFAFDYFQQFQSEIGDACEFFQDSFYLDQEASFSYWVQRQWSNKSAAGGHDPCVPATSDPYFNVTPLDLVDVKIDEQQLGGSAASLTRGIHVPAGQSATFQIGFFSDGPTSGPWTIKAVPGSGIRPSRSTPTISATIDKTSGQNGEKAYVTVTVKSQGALFAGEIVTVTSTLGGVSHYMPIWIGN